VWLALLVLPRGSGRATLRQVCRARVGAAALTGVGIYLTYTLVLLALGFVANVSYAVAFRQLSVPLGAVLGVVLLKEPAYAPKSVGVGIAVIGLVLVGLG